MIASIEAIEHPVFLCPPIDSIQHTRKHTTMLARMATTKLQGRFSTSIYCSDRVASLRTPGCTQHNLRAEYRWIEMSEGRDPSR